VQKNHQEPWFTQQPLIQSIVEIGIDVIGMVKATNQRYLVNNRRLSLKELYSFATHVQGKKGILRSIHTTMANGIKVKELIKWKPSQTHIYFNINIQKTA
jgi:hypothetical protein